jgi:hypothetical protein
MKKRNLINPITALSVVRGRHKEKRTITKPRISSIDKMAMVNKEFIMEGIPSEHVLDSGIETLVFIKWIVERKQLMTNKSVEDLNLL